MGSRSWVAVVLFAAAGAACSKPNPAFVDSDPSVTAGETTGDSTTTSESTSESSATTSESTGGESTTEAAWMPACVEPDYCPPFLNVASLLPPEISAQCVGETHFYVRRVSFNQAEVFPEDDPCLGDASSTVQIDLVVANVLTQGICFEIYHEGYEREGTCRTRAVLVFNEGSEVAVAPPKLAAVVTSFDPPQQLEDLRLRRSRSSMCECVDLCSEPAIGSPLEWCCGGMSEQFGLEFTSMGQSATVEMSSNPLPIFDYRGALYDLYMTRAHVPCGQPMTEDVSWAMIRK